MWNGKLIASSGICLLVASLVSGDLLAARFVAPGDTGSILVPVKNYLQGDDSSVGPMENVEVEVTHPDHFIKKGTSLLGPVPTIAPGGTYSFKVEYEIGDGPEGPFEVKLKVKTITPNTLPKPPDGTWESSVELTTRNRRFLDEIVLAHV